LTVNIKRDAIVTDENAELETEVTLTVIRIPASLNTHSSFFPGTRGEDYSKRANTELYLAPMTHRGVPDPLKQWKKSSESPL